MDGRTVPKSIKDRRSKMVAGGEQQIMDKIDDGRSEMIIDNADISSQIVINSY